MSGCPDTDAEWIPWHRLLSGCHAVVCSPPEMSGLAPNRVRLALNGTNLGLLRLVSVHLGSPSEKVLKLILKSPRCVLFRAYLTYFGSTLTSPDRECVPCLSLQVWVHQNSADDLVYTELRLPVNRVTWQCLQRRDAWPTWSGTWHDVWRQSCQIGPILD